MRVVDPDAEGFGKLASRARPGVTAGYPNAHTPRTMDGSATGDTGSFRKRLSLPAGTQDMFVSGGENVYPAQIRNALLRRPT